MRYITFTATSKNKLNSNLSPGVPLPSSPWSEREEERSWEQGWHNSLPCRYCGLQVALSPRGGFYNTIKEKTCAYTRASPSYRVFTCFCNPCTCLKHIHVERTFSANINFPLNRSSISQCRQTFNREWKRRKTVAREQKGQWQLTMGAGGTDHLMFTQ